MPLRAPKQLFLLFALSLLCACASAPAPVKSAQSYFQEAEASYQSRDYDEAIAAYKKVKESYSSPELSTQAELKIADAHFENKAYIESAAAYEDFRKLHPSHAKAPYALYRLGLSHYNQITGIDTDQTPVKNAVATFENFLTRYPQSEYAAEVQEKRADCQNKQMEYEVYVGHFYLRTGNYASAAKRLNEALVRFPNTPKRAEALYYLGSTYLKTGDKAKAGELFQRLALEFPKSPLNEDAKKLTAR